MRFHSVEERGKLVPALVDLGQAVLAQVRQAVLGRQAIGLIALGRKATIRPGLAQDLVDKLVLVHPLRVRRAQQDLVEEHLGAA